MPCNCDYMNPGENQINAKKIGSYFVYLLTSQNLPVPAKYILAEKDYYGNFGGNPEKNVDPTLDGPILCEMIGKLSKQEMDKLIYNTKDSIGLQLLAWHREHQKQDELRKKQELEAKQLESFISYMQKCVEERGADMYSIAFLKDLYTAFTTRPMPELTLKEIQIGLEIADALKKE